MGDLDNVATAERNYSWREGLDPDVESARRRLEVLLELNAEPADLASKAVSPESAIFRNPISTEKACSILGLTLGTIPTTAIFSNLISDRPLLNDAALLLLLIALAIAGTGAAGYFSGKIVGKVLREMEQASWPLMTVMLFFVGILWGLVSGAAGGLFLIIFGAIPGAMIGAAVGAFALPVFGIIHRLLQKEGLVERNRLLPVAFGISTLAAGLMLGFPGF